VELIEQDFSASIDKKSATLGMFTITLRKRFWITDWKFCLAMITMNFQLLLARLNPISLAYTIRLVMFGNGPKIVKPFYGAMPLQTHQPELMATALIVLTEADLG
jgi:hypothetical protein